MNVKEIVHYYIGAKCTVVRNDKLGYEDIVCIGLLSNFQRSDHKRSDHILTIKPHLRRLEDMTNEEKKECDKQAHKHDTGYNHSHYISDWAYRVDCLLKQHFDLFGLIDAGMAIDAETIIST